MFTASKLVRGVSKGVGQLEKVHEHHHHHHHHGVRILRLLVSHGALFHGWNRAAVCRMERGTTTTITLPTSTRLEMILLLCAQMKYKEL